MTRSFIRIFVLLLCGAFTAGTLAQNSNSTITGTATDTHGAVLSGTSVEVTNVGTGQTYTTQSNAVGYFAVTNLNPANYKVMASAPGFANWVGVLTLRVSQAALVDPKLNAANVTTQVTVKDVTPVIDQVDATLSDVKEATRIETIPLQNRSVLNLLNFTPGVVAGGFAGNAGGGYTRVNGIPGGSLDYLVDGQTMATRWSNELQQVPQPIPTLQEVKIITANGNAQYSRPGIVEMVTKSGTNHFHGQLFELNQNNYLRAKAFNQTSVNYLMHNEYGGQVGGPVWVPKLYNGRNKTFFFVDLEGIRENSAAISQFHVPTTQWKTGDLSTLVDNNGAPIIVYDPLTTTQVGPDFVRTPFPGNIIPTNRINPVTAKILTFLPDPNINVPYWQAPNYSDPNAGASKRNKLYTAKLDQLFGLNRLAMRYTYTSANSMQPSGYILNPNVLVQGGHNGAIVFTQVLGPRTINVLRAGVQYYHNFHGPVTITPPIPIQLGLPNYHDSLAWPSFYFDGVNDSNFSGIDRDNPSDYPDSTITGSDQVSYNRGNHQFMFGFEFQNYRINTFEVGQPGGGYNFSGNFTSLQDPAQVAQGTFNAAAPGTGSGFADFLLGELDGLFLNVYPHYHTEQTEYAGFAQDDWRVTKNLTLNIGVRYTYWTPFSDTAGLLSTLDPNIAGGMVVYKGSATVPPQTTPELLNAFKTGGLPIESAAQAGYPLSLWNMPKNNWDPRIGFAYQMDSKTVLRGAWGMYHWAMPLQQFQQATRKNPPFSYSLSLGPDNVINGDPAAAELEFPIASAQYGGPQPVDQFQLGQPTTTLNTNPASLNSGGGWGICPMDPNYKPQTVQEYNLTIARELPGHTGAQISYVGNRSTNLLQLDPINFTIPRELAPPGASPAQRRKFPLFATSVNYDMSEFRYNGYSNTNELQAQLTHTFGNGLLLQAFYTWQRTLTTTESQFLGTLGNVAMMLPASLTNNAPDSERLRGIYAPDSNLPFHTFSINGHYELPFGRGKRYLGNAHGWVNELISGYNISPFFYWRSGLPFSPYWTPFGSAIVLAPGKHGGVLPESQRKASRWFDPSIAREDLGQPYNGEAFIERANPLDDDFRNNSPRNYMTGPGFNNLDATIYKLTPIAKGSVLDIEAQIFNVYNHQNLALPSLTSGVISSGVGLPRLIQLQAKFIF
jgi:hypothetical protein